MQHRLVSSVHRVLPWATHRARNGILQNGMLFVATRQYAKTAGKPAKKAASKEIAQNASTGLTIKLTDEELTLPIEQLSFEQLYRRILHIWEEGKADPKKVWMFDLLKKAQTDEEWGQMLIICRIYQHRMFLFNANQASYFIMLGCDTGNEDRILKMLFYEEAPRLFCNKSGYIYLMKKFLDKNDFASAWKVLDLITKRTFIDAYARENKVDEALRTITVQKKMSVPMDSSFISGLIHQLYKLDRHNDIISLAHTAKTEGGSLLPSDLPFFINALLHSGNEVEAAALVKEAGGGNLESSVQTLIEGAQTQEMKDSLYSMKEKIAKLNK